MNLPQTYAGHRILEAMRSAPRYADAVYRLMRSALTPGSARVLDFGAGDGTLSAPVLTYTGTNPTSVATGDINGDGKQDAVVLEPSESSMIDGLNGSKNSLRAAAAGW